MPDPLPLPDQPPINLPDLGEPPPPAGDGKSANEAAVIAAGANLADREALNKVRGLEREDAMGAHLHRVLVVGLWIVGLCVATMFLVLVWNMVVGAGWRFLDTEEQADLFKFLFSGVLGSGVSAAARKVLGKDQSSPPAH